MTQKYPTPRRRKHESDFGAFGRDFLFVDNHRAWHGK